MIGQKRESGERNIKHEIDILKKKFRKIELKPCYGDADIKRKEKDLSSLRKEIYSLEKEINQFAFPILFN